MDSRLAFSHGPDGRPLCLSQKNYEPNNSLDIDDFKVAQNVCSQHKWPALSRVYSEATQFVYPNVNDGWTYIWDENPTRALHLCKRSREDLAAYTVLIEPIAGRWYRRPYVCGSRPTINAVRRVLEQLHVESQQKKATPDQIKTFYRDRVCKRADLNCSSAVSHEIQHWPGWKELEQSEVTWGTWHGDPNTYNAVQTTGGRVVLIDHAATSHGPLEYDYAKLLRAELLDNDLRRHSDWDKSRNNPHLAAVVAGMIGTHYGATREALLDLWRAIK